MFALSSFDHVGIRVTDIERSQAFYEGLGFVVDPTEESPEARARGFVNGYGLRVHLIYNGVPSKSGNVLMDVHPKHPGYTHAAFVVDDMDRLIAWLDREGIPITEGPVVWGEDALSATRTVTSWSSTDCSTSDLTGPDINQRHRRDPHNLSARPKTGRQTSRDESENSVRGQVEVSGRRDTRHHR
jgi:catechol 2,3-dioxygenase-like lactoylglutathione lyase family enzyme